MHAQRLPSQTLIFISSDERNQIHAMQLISSAGWRGPLPNPANQIAQRRQNHSGLSGILANETDLANGIGWIRELVAGLHTVCMHVYEST